MAANEYQLLDSIPEFGCSQSLSVKSGSSYDMVYHFFSAKVKMRFTLLLFSFWFDGLARILRIEDNVGSYVSECEGIGLVTAKNRLLE